MLLVLTTDPATSVPKVTLFGSLTVTLVVEVIVLNLNGLGAGVKTAFRCTAPSERTSPLFS